MHDPERRYSARYPLLHKLVTKGDSANGLDELQELLVFAIRTLNAWSSQTEDNGFTPQETTTLIDEIRDIRAGLAFFTDRIKGIDIDYLEIEKCLVNTLQEAGL
jgi:hypothetical protein